MWTFQIGSKPPPNFREQPEHVATDEGREQMSVNTREMEIVHRVRRVIWHVIGRPRYVRHIRRVRG
jgi:hypothetical protein